MCCGTPFRAVVRVESEKECWKSEDRRPESGVGTMALKCMNAWMRECMNEKIIERMKFINQQYHPYTFYLQYQIAKILIFKLIFPFSWNEKNNSPNQSNFYIFVPPANHTESGKTNNILMNIEFIHRVNKSLLEENIFTYHLIFLSDMGFCRLFNRKKHTRIAGISQYKLALQYLF